MIPVILFHILLPSVFILLCEYFLFFRSTLSDIERVKTGYFKRIRDQIQDRISSMPPDAQIYARAYVESVHRNTEKDYAEFLVSKQAYRERMELRARILLFLLIAFVTMLGWTYRRVIHWEDLIMQTVGTAVLLVAFQLYFYYGVGKKYQFTSL